MPDNKFQISESLLERLRYFIEDSDPLRASRHLRRVFFDYLKFQDGVVDKDFDSILSNIETLFELLDAIADEKNVRIKSE